MPISPPLSLRIERHKVALHYRGAEGITFQDAVLVVDNDGAASVGEVVLRLRVSQQGKLLFDGDVRPGLLGLDDRLEGGATLRMSVFRIFQKAMPGFASKVNLFGYKAALNWSYGVAFSTGGAEPLVKNIRWSPSLSDGEHVEVEIG